MRSDVATLRHGVLQARFRALPSLHCPRRAHYFSLMVCGLLVSVVGAATGAENSVHANSSTLSVPRATEEANSPGAATPASKSPSATVQIQEDDAASTTGSVASATQQPAQSGTRVAQIPRSQIARQLWQTRVTVPKSEEERQYSKELQDIIERIRSLSFEPGKRISEPAIAVKPKITFEPNDALPVPERPQRSVERQTKSDSVVAPPYEPLAGETLQVLKAIAEDPNQIRNPLELAEVIYLSGNEKEAVVFYRQALSRIAADDVTVAQDKAWILFQIGNCLRYDDMPAAKRAYRQLITEHAESPWTDLAKSQEQLIDWYLQDKPGSLITASK